MSRLVARSLPILLAIGLAACAAPTAPAPSEPLRAHGVESPSFDETTVTDSVVTNTTCRSGYSTAQGRCL